MRLIDADALIKALEVIQYNDIDDLSRTEDLIDNAPTVEPFEPDYVGAERLKARQRGYADGYHNGMEIGKTLNPKIKQGWWIPDKVAFYWVCSECGAEVRSNIAEVYLTEHTLNFCPNCGADMRKGDES